MIEVKAKKLTMESFAKFGHFGNMTEPDGFYTGGDAFLFYRDMVRMHVGPRMGMGFSPLVVKKPAEYRVPCMEFHDYTAEVMLPLEDDAVLCLAPANGGETPSAEQIEAFIIPKGTLIHINPGTWHYVPMPVNKEQASVLIVLPERTYRNDLIAEDFDIVVSL